ncbi:hypothetical protein [Marinilabilia rubra]|uniref:hypothetical protein n=1 Tax=Marinilabilia rubra TaxID=2162893 RepID=UPI0011B1EC4F|nr:hypothetical protein [Marinilabilia rubra]
MKKFFKIFLGAFLVFAMGMNVVQTVDLSQKTSFDLNSLMQIAYADGESGSSMNCNCSGGTGASSCSCSSAIASVSSSCSVSCNSGYYACCSTDNICKCIKS